VHIAVVSTTRSANLNGRGVPGKSHDGGLAKDVFALTLVGEKLRRVDRVKSFLRRKTAIVSRN
jgi:hypothetical protein